MPQPTSQTRVPGRAQPGKNPAKTLYTVGHSTRSIDEFVSILRVFEVRVLADVRTLRGSRRVPQFNAESLKRDLAKAQIRYIAMPSLGGLRKARPDSPNAAWRNASFRGYADYMQTPEFEAGLQELMEIAMKEPTAIMCAEAVPWRCHRSLIGDALVVRGWNVLDLMSPTSARPHKLTDFAEVRGKRVTYPATKSGE